jgi:hypothetical protein
MEHWLAQWSKMMSSARNLQDFPLWLQYFSKIIFLVINKSGEFNILSVPGCPTITMYNKTDNFSLL